MRILHDTKETYPDALALPAHGDAIIRVGDHVVIPDHRADWHGRIREAANADGQVVIELLGRANDVPMRGSRPAMGTKVATP